MQNILNWETQKENNNCIKIFLIGIPRIHVKFVLNAYNLPIIITLKKKNTNLKIKSKSIIKQIVIYNTYKHLKYTLFIIQNG